MWGMTRVALGYAHARRADVLAAGRRFEATPRTASAPPAHHGECREPALSLSKHVLSMVRRGRGTGGMVEMLVERRPSRSGQRSGCQRAGDPPALRRPAIAVCRSEGKWPRGPISRILCPDASRGGGHLSSPPVAGRIVRPTRGRGRAPLPREADVPLFGLAPGGVCQHPVSPPGLVRSYRTLSPLPAPRRDGGRRRSALCGTFRRLATPGRYPAPRPRESGLSSPMGSGRPPGPLGHSHHTAPAGRRSAGGSPTLWQPDCCPLRECRRSTSVSTISPSPCLVGALATKPLFVYRTGVCRGALPLCRGHGGVPPIWIYHPLPGQEGGRGDGRKVRGAPTAREQERRF